MRSGNLGLFCNDLVGDVCSELLVLSALCVVCPRYKMLFTDSIDFYDLVVVRGSLRSSLSVTWWPDVRRCVREISVFRLRFA
jgi:hypothetical protein